MKKLLLFISLGFCTFSIGQELDSLYKKMQEHVNDYPVYCEVAAAIVQGDSVSYIGIASTPEGVVPVDNRNLIFEIGSITKVFTSAILSYYVSEKKLKAKHKVNKYLPFEVSDEITFQNLSNHTAGLARLPYNFFNKMKDSANPYVSYTEEDFVDYAKTQLVHENKVGSISIYSNLGAAFLAYVLEHVENKKYPDLLEEIIFEKFGMTSTSLDNDYETVEGHDESGVSVSNWQWCSPLFATGGLRSNVTDMALFIKAYCDEENEFLQNMSKPTFEVNEQMSMGLAMHLIHMKDGKSFSFHNGGTGGFSSSMAIYPEEKVGIILLANKSDKKLDYLLFGMMKEILG